MAGERHGIASWPGAIAVESCTYTMSHGITPGTAILKILPQTIPVSPSGTLIIGDGADEIILPDCRLDDLKVEQSEGGFVWSLQISDRRWKWRDFGSISGAYNQLDEIHKKLIPWTIRSPLELVKLLLDEMLETGYVIDMPPGFTAADGRAFANANPPWIGVNPGNTNPPVNWVNETPMVALQNLCEQFGRRVILQHKTNSVLIAIPGRGNGLPDGSIARDSPSIKNPATPARVAVYGAPTIYQMRLQLQAVGEEWDGSFRPIDELSYKPLPAGGKPQISTATVTANGSSNTFQIFIGALPEDPPTTGALFEFTSSSTASTVASGLAAAINASADPRVQGKVTASAASGVVTVTGVKDGEPFTFWSRMSGSISGVGDVDIVPALTQAAVNPSGGWEYSVPPTFSDVRETDRLRKVDAVRLAQKTIYRYYQLTGVDASRRGGPIRVPNYGFLKRRQQVILTSYQVEQVVPQPLDDRLLGRDHLPFLENFYNGYSRAKPAICYGAMLTLKSGGAVNAFWVPGLGKTNTKASDRIFVDFTVDPDNQLIIFANHVFKVDGPRYLPSVPVVQTGVMIRNADSNALEAFVAGKRLPGVVDNNLTAVRTYLDVQYNVIGKYDDQHHLTGLELNDQFQIDAQKRAAYYVDGLAAQYITSAALSRDYNGIVSIQLDGAISQITWEVGGHGSMTTASVNTEHSLWVPPYPARRRSEFLRPAQQAAILQTPANFHPSQNQPLHPIVD